MNVRDLKCGLIRHEAGLLACVLINDWLCCCGACLSFHMKPTLLEPGIELFA